MYIYTYIYIFKLFVNFMLTFNPLDLLLISLILVFKVGLFHNKLADQNPAVVAPELVQSSLCLCRAK